MEIQCLMALFAHPKCTENVQFLMHPLNIFLIAVLPPTGSLQHSTVAEGAQSGGSTGHTYIHACLAGVIEAQSCITAFAVLWQEKFIPETVA